MPYQNNIPQANDRISTSQADIQTNFAEIQNVITVDHIDFADPNQGKHSTVTFPEQAADPATAVDEIKVYSKDDGAETALYLRKENSGDIIGFTTGTMAAAGECRLPCGLKMKWATGLAGNDGGQGRLNTFITPFANPPFTILITERTPGGVTHNFVQVVTASIAAANFRATSFDGNSNWSDNTPINYLAIGV